MIDSWENDELPAWDCDQRAAIRLEAGKLHEIATHGESALIKAGAPFYAYGDEIKRPVIDEVEASKGRMTKVARLTSVNPDMLRDHLSRVAQWEKFDARARKFVAADPPRDIASTILSRDGEWRFPRIVGVITTPTLRPDGSILTEPGYDAATRLVLMDPPALPVLPDKPTRNDGADALALLEGLLGEFPFVDDASRSVALSALITPVVRGAMAVAPMHVATAPTPGSGKSFLFDTAAAISTGQICPVISAGGSEDETEKRLSAALLKGQPLISIDNLNGELRGDALCQFIERPVVDVRVLGFSKLVRIESRSTIFGNGNNIRVVGDIVRRAIVTKLDANMERPETRQFTRNPVDAVLTERGRYIAAALTVVRAYIAAGSPNSSPDLASFEQWSRLVRSALIWLGRADPVESMEAARADDPALGELRKVVSAWRDAAAGTNAPMAAGDLKALADRRERIGGGEYHEQGEWRQSHPDLNEALRDIAIKGNEISALRLGHWLRAHRGRVIEGVKIHGEEDSHTKQIKWSLQPLAA